MQVDQSIDEAYAEAANAVSIQPQFRRQVAAQDGAGEALHHVEILADDLGVIAAREDRRHIGIAGLQGVHHARLAQHVVGGLGLGASRRSAQHQFAIRIAEKIGEVGRAAGKLLHRRRAFKPIDVLLEEGVDACDVEQVFLAHRTGLVGNRRHAWSSRASCALASSLATTARCTSSGPSASRSTRA
jgi:hypothetical protein